MAPPMGRFFLSLLDARRGGEGSEGEGTWGKTDQDLGGGASLSTHHPPPFPLPAPPPLPTQCSLALPRQAALHPLVETCLLLDRLPAPRKRDPCPPL